MHDQSVEQKLRAALQAEGDGLAFTITAAELERRLHLRRRTGLGPIGSLGLAAAVGLGLLGLAGVAGGWFEQRTAVPPSLAAVASATPSIEPSPSTQTAVLPSIDDLLAPLDPATIVRAQAVGPAAGPSASGATLGTGSRGAGFAPVSTAGVYRVWAGCLGETGLELVATNPDLREPREVIPLTCDGTITTRQVGLEAGDTVSVRSASPVSWRIVVEALAREARRAPSIAEIVVPAGDATLLDAHSTSVLPDGGPIGTGGGTRLPADVGWVAHRDEYRVFVTCAGPSSIRYAFSGQIDQSTPEVAPQSYAATDVECDGAVHQDVLDLPLDEARFVVTSSDQIAWHIIVTGDPLPIALAPDEDGWVTSSGFGPNWQESRFDQGVSLPGEPDGGQTRIVISCSGATTITGTIDVGPVADQTLDPFTLDCNVEHQDAVTIARTYADAAGQVQVTYDPHGGQLWIAITVQVRAPASPAP